MGKGVGWLGEPLKRRTDAKTSVGKIMPVTASFKARFFFFFFVSEDWEN